MTSLASLPHLRGREGAAAFALIFSLLAPNLSGSSARRVPHGLAALIPEVITNSDGSGAPGMSMLPSGNP